MILASALKILKKQGTEFVNVKTIAKNLNCSTQPIYLSFENMEHLRKELIPAAVNEFENIMKTESKNNIICLYGMEYIYFAKNEPKLFSFLFMRSNAFEEIKRMLLPIIENSITELMSFYNISHEEADLLHDHLWMHTHGIASMIATDFCLWNIDKVKYMLEECKKAFTKKYEM